jgi:hypothetical protein
MIKFQAEERPLRPKTSMSLHLGHILAFFSGLWRKRARRIASPGGRTHRAMMDPTVNRQACFTSILAAGGVRQFSARGEHPRVTQLLLDAVRVLPGGLGIAIVELGESPREWVGTGVSRGELLEAILALRDLLGHGALDLAVFSSSEGVEIYLDRGGLLEIRASNSWEPRARSLLEAQHFVWAPRLPDAWSPSPTSPAARDRIAAVAEFLALRIAPAPYRARN